MHRSQRHTLGWEQVRASLRRLRALRPIGLALALVPAVYSAQVQLTGVPDAAGCGGAGPYEDAATPTGVTWLWVPDDARDIAHYKDPVPVATDGFFPIAASLKDISLEDAVASLDVTVTDYKGQAIAGETKVLTAGEFLVGWTAASPLAMGEQLTVRISTRQGTALPRTTSLKVVGPPPPLALPEVTFGDWYTLGRGTGSGSGNPVECSVAAPTVPCGQTTAKVPESVAVYRAADYGVKFPVITGTVVWRLALEPVTSKGTLVTRSLGPLAGRTLSFLGEPIAGFTVGEASFTDEVPEYCVRLHLFDVRSGAEATTPPVCKPSGPRRSTRDESGLARCLTPPTPELTSSWCLLSSLGPRDMCPLDDAGAAASGAGGSDVGSGGSAASGPGGSTAGSGGSAAPAGAGGSGGGLAAAPKVEASETSGGCALAANGASRASWLAFVAAVLGWAFSRRRR